MIEQEKQRQEGEFFLKAKILDIQTGHYWVILMHEDDAKTYGIRAGDELNMCWNHKKTEVGVDLTKNLVQPGEIGLALDIIKKYKIQNGEVLKLSLAAPPSSLKCIQKKLQGKKLSYQEAKAIINDIVHYHLDDIQIAFFVASGFGQNAFSLEEIYYLTKAMAETGEMLHWEGVVADKHSIGGVPGNRTTPLVVSIISSLGIKIPKTSSRAITSEAGTADVMEAVCPVEFTAEKIKEIVKEVNACLVWGGSLKLAPADDRILKVSYELGIEPYSKMIISIMAKKVAMGATHLVIDLPMGPGLKINTNKDVQQVKKVFEYLAKKFHIKIKIVVTKIKGPIGKGIGPLLEIRDILRVLSQTENRPLDLEQRAVTLAGALLELIGVAKKGQGKKIAWQQLQNKEALKQFQRIVKAQGGLENLEEKDLKLGTYQYEVKSQQTGRVKMIDNQNLIRLVRLLGSPITKEAGIYLNKSLNEKVIKGEVLFTLYTTSEQRLSLAKKELEKISLYFIT